MPITGRVIERLLRGASGSQRTALVAVAAATSWGCGLISLIAGWQAGLVVLMAGSVALTAMRRSFAPKLAVATQLDSDSPDSSEVLSAEERVLARLRQIQSQNAEA